MEIHLICDRSRHPAEIGSEQGISGAWEHVVPRDRWEPLGASLWVECDGGVLESRGAGKMHGFPQMACLTAPQSLGRLLRAKRAPRLQGPGGLNQMLLVISWTRKDIQFPPAVLALLLVA